MDASHMTAEKNCILIVDDDFINRTVLQNIFSEGYTFDEAENGLEALEKITSHPDRLCAILLDVNMPEMDGIELLRRLHQQGLTESIPIFLITANDEVDIAQQAYELGVMDVINKPVVSFIIRRRVQSVIELFRARESLSATVVGQEKKLKENEDIIDKLNRGTIEALASAIEFRDMESGDHTNRIYSITKCILTNTAMGDSFTPEEIENISIGSIMHDLGKIAISDVILNKPGRLSAEEFEVMKQHTVKGADLMQQLHQLQTHPCYAYACDIARHHHERWDGRGYPDGLKEDEISVWSQVVSIADVYDALICPRVYKKPFTPDAAVQMIIKGECGMFNPHLVECFLQVEPHIRQFYAPDADLDALLAEDSKHRNQKQYFTPKPQENKTAGMQEVSDTLLLISAITASFDMIICSNLTKNTYYMMTAEHFQTHCTGNDGVFDDLIHYGSLSVPESHRQRFYDAFNREKLLKDYAAGCRNVALNHPQYADNGEIHRVKTTVALLEDSRTGDIIDLTFSRYIDREWESQEKHLMDLENIFSLLEMADLPGARDALQAVINEQKNC